MCQSFQYSPVKIGEPFAIIIISIEPFTFEIIFIIDKVIGYSLIEKLFNPTILISPANRNCELFNFFISALKSSAIVPYFGRITLTSVPRLFSSLGREPATSASPLILQMDHILKLQIILSRIHQRSLLCPFTHNKRISGGTC